jgi:hypothetical protein
MINQVGTVAKSNKKIVAIETKTDTRSLFWLGRDFSILSLLLRFFYLILQLFRLGLSF